MIKAGIIRGLMPRLTQAEFAKSISGFQPVFITGEASIEIKRYCQKNKLILRDLNLKNIFGIDPLSLIFQKKLHQSWVGVDNFTGACKDLSVLETYELYHFFSGQAASVAQKLNIPLVTEVWTSFSHHPAYLTPPYSWNVQKVIRQTSLFIARSKRAANSLIDMNIPAEKIATIYHGVNLKRFKPVFTKPKNLPKKVLYVGELTDYKGVGLLLNIWPKVLEKYPKSELVLVGNGPLFPKAQKVKGVIVKGFINHLELPAIYNSCDLFISPSIDRYLGPFLWWEEFFSYSLMEAQASGLPIIATKSGGIPEEIGDDNWLVPQKNPEALVSAVLEALSNDKLLAERGRKNRARAEKYFNIDIQTKILEREIKKLIF